MSQTKEQHRAPEKEPNKMETRSLPRAAFRTLAITAVPDLGGTTSQGSYENPKARGSEGTVMWALGSGRECRRRNSAHLLLCAPFLTGQDGTSTAWGVRTPGL